MRERNVQQEGPPGQQTQHKIQEASQQFFAEGYHVRLGMQMIVYTIDKIPRMVLGTLSTPYQAKSSEPASSLQTVCGVTGSAGSPIARTSEYHAGSQGTYCQNVKFGRQEKAILFKLKYIIEELRGFFCSLQQVRNVTGNLHGSFCQSLCHFFATAIRCERPYDLLEYHFALAKPGTQSLDDVLDLNRKSL